ncbi:urease accessory protein [Blastococcus aurantiacus]|uniref:Urease accessory protein UreF n=1 Tax=Blastococcus aurantiacus TaxID=1550231 RepID=A0A1G7MQP1_9ACTN|nr:urease accessory UreF family protein [Blastococcus aurantiacus]SDF64034.1 urease accessory protein [Blastococcus aurantiacus]
MPPDRWDAELAWLQLHDSAFPSGRFVHSNGLEAWLAAHPAAGAEVIAAVIEAHLRHNVGTLDAVCVAHAYRAGSTADLVRLDRLVRAHKLSAAARTASESCGRQLALAARRTLAPLDHDEFLGLVAAGETPGNLAVVEGVVHRGLSIGLARAVLGHLRSAYSGMLSAGVRLGRIGPLETQRRLFAGAPLLVELAGAAVETPIDGISAVTPELDVYAMRHETTAARLFST